MASLWQILSPLAQPENLGFSWLAKGTASYCGGALSSPTDSSSADLSDLSFYLLDTEASNPCGQKFNLEKSIWFFCPQIGSLSDMGSQLIHPPALTPHAAPAPWVTS